MDKEPHPYHAKLLQLEAALDAKDKEKLVQVLKGLKEERLDIMPEVEYAKYSAFEPGIIAFLGEKGYRAHNPLTGA